MCAHTHTPQTDTHICSHKKVLAFMYSFIEKEQKFYNAQWRQNFLHYYGANREVLLNHIFFFFRGIFSKKNERFFKENIFEEGAIKISKLKSLSFCVKWQVAADPQQRDRSTPLWADREILAVSPCSQTWRKGGSKGLLLWGLKLSVVQVGQSGQERMP